MYDPNSKRWETWLQWALLFLTLIGAALHGEGRVARLEQAHTDDDKQREEITAHLDRIEQRIDKIADAAR